MYNKCILYMRGEDMKKKELVSKLNAKGYYFIRSGKHEMFSNGVRSIAIPHGPEINERLAKAIVRQLGL